MDFSMLLPLRRLRLPRDRREPFETLSSYAASHLFVCYFGRMIRNPMNGLFDRVYLVVLSMIDER